MLLLVSRGRHLWRIYNVNPSLPEIDTDEMVASDKLELVDLRHNPFTRSTHRKLSKAEAPYKIELSELVEEDW